MTPEWPRDKWQACKFWDNDYEKAVTGVLVGYSPGFPWPWKDADNAMWKHCELLESNHVPD